MVRSLQHTMDDHKFDIVGNVPPELSQKIVKSFALNELLKCQAVSRTWFSIINCNVIWKKFVKDNHPEKEVNLRRDFRWLVLTPCEAKLKVLNHKRVVRNWREDKYNRFKLRDAPYNCTAYDGYTLVASRKPPNQGVSVYKVERGKLWTLQFIKMESCVITFLATNTRFIIVNSGAHIFVYSLAPARKNAYRLAYVLCQRSESGVMKRIQVESNKESHVLNCCTDPLESVKVCLLCNTLFVYYGHANSMYAWELEKEQLLLHNALDDVGWHGFVTDGKQMYSAFSKTISAYDEQSDLIYSIKADHMISKMMVNDNLIVTLHEQAYACYDKYSGDLVFKGMEPLSTDSLLHPSANIIFDKSDESDIMQVYALELKTDLLLWTTRMMATMFLGSLHSIIADDCLLVTPFCGQACDVYDAKKGNYMYTMLVEEAVGSSIMTHYDVLIYYNPRESSLIVNVYS